MIAQPAEEIGLGAMAMINDGLFTRFPKPDHVIALHDHAGLPAGMMGIGSGFVMANVDSIDLTITGKGGHGAYPQDTRDPIVIAARIVTTLQTLVSREIDPLDSAVVTVGAFNGGFKHNIIPDEVKLQLTVRSFADATREKLLVGIERIAPRRSAGRRARSRHRHLDQCESRPYALALQRARAGYTPRRRRARRPWRSQRHHRHALHGGRRLLPLRPHG